MSHGVNEICALAGLRNCYVLLETIWCLKDAIQWFIPILPLFPHVHIRKHFLLLVLTLVCVCAQSCLTLHAPLDCSPPSYSVHGISQARILEWVAIAFSSRSSRSRGRTHVSCVSCIVRQILCH